jgi:flagellar biosynthesis protein FlhB
LAGQDQKTEKPTQRRLQKTRSEGRFPVSRDFMAALQFATVFIVGLQLGRQGATDLIAMTGKLLRHAFELPVFTAADLEVVLKSWIAPFFFRIFLVGFSITLLLTLVQLATTGFGFSTKQLMPDLSRLNTFSKVKQLPKENFTNALRSLVLTVFIGFFLYSLIKEQVQDIANLSLNSLFGGLAQAGDLFTHLLKQVAIVLVLFGVVDLARQRAKFMKNLRMSKQEIKDEHKETEGNTEYKMRIRRLQRDAVRRSMIKAVEKSTVVITNPTHYAIAIQYEMGSRSVPTVVAKGKNYLAKTIRERARAHDIPVIENKPLAQALYQAVEVGSEIPPGLYKAVAEVLAQIYRVINRQ